MASNVISVQLIRRYNKLPNYTGDTISQITLIAEY